MWRVVRCLFPTRPIFDGPHVLEILESNWILSHDIILFWFEFHLSSVLSCLCDMSLVIFQFYFALRHGENGCLFPARSLLLRSTSD